MNNHQGEPARDTIYCFDFDGVLCDSMDESLVMSYSAYFSQSVKSVSEIDPDLRDFFREHRHMVRPAEEYYILYYAYERGERVIGPDRFARLKADLAEKMKTLADRFYAYRVRLRKDLDYWVGLHRPYSQCSGFLEKREQPFFIVTNKDRDSVVALARHYGYSDRIAGIYSREMAIKKTVLLEKLFEERGLSPSTSRIVFVDDHEGTLTELKTMPLDLYLAAWGYTRGLNSGAFRLIHSLDELP
jgi:FMN phosphatase YigB (HAD superfamily)